MMTCSRHQYEYMKNYSTKETSDARLSSSYFPYPPPSPPSPSSSSSSVSEISPGVKAAGAYGWRPTTLAVPNVEMIRGLNLPGTPTATSACRGTPLLYSFSSSVISRSNHLLLLCLHSQSSSTPVSPFTIIFYSCVSIHNHLLLVCLQSLTNSCALHSVSAPTRFGVYWQSSCNSVATQITSISLSSSPISINVRSIYCFNPLNAELNAICHLMVLLGAHHILHVSRIRVN
jgi:hypothetical protein